MVAGYVNDVLAATPRQPSLILFSLGKHTYLKAIDMTKIGYPVPELPVGDLERARSYYCDRLGFEKAWALPEIAAVSRKGQATIFFRLSSLPIVPQSHWIYAEDLDGTFEEMQAAGATIVDPLSVKPWGMRQFTVRDPDGHQFHIHHDT